MKRKSTEETLREEIEEKNKEIQERKNLLALMERFPDLEKRRNRWKQVRYSTAEVNSQVTHCDVGHNCGCCADSSLEVWPYVDVDGLKIYSKPEVFSVGEKNACGPGEVPRPYWEHRMEEAGISEAVIAKVQKYLDENPPKYPKYVTEDEWKD